MGSCIVHLAFRTSAAGMIHSQGVTGKLFLRARCPSPLDPPASSLHFSTRPLSALASAESQA
jgi:hypothetical protein